MRVVPAVLGAVRRYALRGPNREDAQLLRHMSQHVFDGQAAYALSLDPPNTARPTYVGLITWRISLDHGARLGDPAPTVKYALVTGLHVDPKMRRQSVATVLWTKMEKVSGASRVFAYVGTLPGVGFLRNQKVPMWNLLRGGSLIADGAIGAGLRAPEQGTPIGARRLFGDIPPMTDEELNRITWSEDEQRLISL